MWKPMLGFPLKPVQLHPTQNYFPSYLKREMAEAGECLRCACHGQAVLQTWPRRSP
jgi:hypothetical protein